MTRIERVLTRLGIEFKRGGKELLAKCPNPAHQDSDPSWRIRDEDGGDKDGMHHCWPCSFSGNLITLVQAKLGPGTSYAAAKTWLAGDADAPRNEIESVDVLVRHHPQFSLPAGVEPWMPLSEWPTIIRDYLINRNNAGNNVTALQVQRWGITWARRGTLAGRIVIPYEDSKERLLGYTARSYMGDRRRYLEAEPKHDGSSLGALFGERHWPEDRHGVLFVTEGAFNAMAVEQALGTVPLAALAGSEIRVQHATKICSWRRIVIATDPDAAGDALAEKITTLTSRYGTRTYRALLPRGQDADSLPIPQLNDILFSAFSKAVCHE